MEDEVLHFLLALSGYTGFLYSVMGSCLMIVSRAFKVFDREDTHFFVCTIDVPTGFLISICYLCSQVRIGNLVFPA